MSTARLAIKSLLGTVNSSATAVTNVVNVVNDSVGMLNTYVAAEAKKQRISIAINDLTYQEKLAEETAIEETQRKIEIKQFTDKSPLHAQLFNDSYNRVLEAMKGL